MTPEGWRQIEHLYHLALEQEANARAAFLAKACADDESLRKEVESLLRAGEGADDYLETPAMEAAARIHARDQARWDLAGKVVSHYRILERLGGALYRSEDTRLGRPVALKFLPSLAGDSEARERFEREARAASALNHPSICTIYDVDDWGGVPFLVMEFLEGESLDRRLTGKALTADELVDLALQIADGLEAAHARGLLHGGLNTANLFITSRGQAKILGFGLACLPAETACSPEGARGEALDARSDLFSLGVVLYEIGAGRKAFEGGPDAILNRVPASVLQWNPSLPPSLDGVIAKALEKDREVRYQHAADLRADLKRLKREMDLARISTSAAGARHDQPSRLGRYRITGMLGSGGMGTVYQGIDPVIGRDVAIKTITADRLGSPQEAVRMRESLQREARAAGSLAHANIVTVFDAGEQEGLTYIVMELIQGSTLEAILPAGGPSPTPRALEILREAAAALDFAHNHGVVHRDVKPSNIMIQAGGAVKLADFGIARRVTAATVTVPGSVAGTPYFMSPEQLRGQEAGPRSDQYSLAVVAWILLTGSRPFDDDSLVPLVSKILAQEPRENSFLSRPAEAAMRRALAKEAGARFESCGAFVAALSNALVGEPATQIETGLAKRRRILVGVGVGAACLLAVGAIAWWPRPRTRVIQQEAISSPAPPPASPQPTLPDAPVAAVERPAAKAPPSRDHAPDASAGIPCQSASFDPKLYGDALSGEMSWVGSLAHGGRLSIENRRASAGRVQGDVLPAGAPVRISVSPAWVRLEMAPTAANCWAPRLVLQNTGEPAAEIRIRWEVYQP